MTLTDRLQLIVDELAHAEALIETLAAENAELHRLLSPTPDRAGPDRPHLNARTAAPASTCPEQEQ